MRSGTSSGSEIDSPPARSSFLEAARLGTRNKGAKPEKPEVRISFHERTQEDMTISRLVGVEECKGALQPSSANITDHVRLEEDAIQEDFYSCGVAAQCEKSIQLADFPAPGRKRLGSFPPACCLLW